MDTEDKNLLIGLCVVLTGAAALIGLIAFGSYLYERNLQCPAFARNVERPYRYDFFAGGCFVQTSTGQWVAEKNYWNNPVLK